MANVVTSNTVLENVMELVYQVLNEGLDVSLHLFQNDVTPTPADTDPAIFQEANYPGYAALDSLGQWGEGPTVFVPGESHLVSDPFDFGEIESGSQTIYGWWIEVEGTIWFSFLFPTPIELSSERPTLALVIDLSGVARSILPC